jgi:hypothetical protein
LSNDHRALGYDRFLAGGWLMVAGKKTGRWQWVIAND